jgi:hypothetical protein
MAENLSSEEIKSIEKVFDYIDKYEEGTKNGKLQLKSNPNGFIDYKELLRAINNLDLTIPVYEAQTFYDENADKQKGGINLNTFIKLVSEYSTTAEKNKAQEKSEQNMNVILNSKESRYSSGGRLHRFNPISTDNQMNYACNYKPDPIPRLENMYSYTDAQQIRPKQYSNFSEIKGGQIEYLPYRRTVIDNFREPVFVNNAFIKSRIYKDPMGSIKPEYTRIETKNNVDIDQFNWMKDTCEMREDLMARQMSRDNRTRYEPKWNL